MQIANELTEQERVACATLDIAPEVYLRDRAFRRRRQALAHLAPEGTVALLLVVHADGSATLDVQRGKQWDCSYARAPLEQVLNKHLSLSLSETRDFLGLAASDAAGADQGAATTR